MVHTGRRDRDGGDQAYHQLHKGGRRRRLQNGGRLSSFSPRLHFCNVLKEIAHWCNGDVVALHGAHGAGGSMVAAAASSLGLYVDNTVRRSGHGGGVGNW